MLASLGFVLLAACVGEAPPDQDLGDGGVDQPAPAAQVERVTGKAMDYFVANTPLQGVALATDGINPQLTTTSATDGAFTFPMVPGGRASSSSRARARTTGRPATWWRSATRPWRGTST